MKVFKFGGASVKNAEAVKNVIGILQKFQHQKIIVIVSAIGKTTNNLEEITKAIWEQRIADFDKHLALLTENHLDILSDLFPEKQHRIYEEIQSIFELITLKYHGPLSDNYNFEYDQIVSLGEVMSTKIIDAFAKEQGIPTEWLDARKLIRTNNTYREGEVDWKRTGELINQHVLPAFDRSEILFTQGFIGQTPEGFTTTLGREGSDYTAAIFAYCLDADSVTIWKDVPGMLNADPKYFENTIKLDKISFYEAIELAYYGASVIHPKTVKPLQNKNIPLFVKSFLDPDAQGTVIQASAENDHLVPSFIFKFDQTLFSFKTRDFSFIVESHLSDIFHRLAALGAKINVMQNSALSFSILVDQSKVNANEVVELFRDDYVVKFNEGLELVTIRHYDQATIELVTAGKEILLQQKTRQTARIVLRAK